MVPGPCPVRSRNTQWKIKGGLRAGCTKGEGRGTKQSSGMNLRKFVYMNLEISLISNIAKCSLNLEGIDVSRRLGTSQGFGLVTLLELVPSSVHMELIVAATWSTCFRTYLSFCVVTAGLSAILLCRFCVPLVDTVEVSFQFL